MTFEEANNLIRNGRMLHGTLFGLEYYRTLCARCIHKEACLVKETGIIKCNFYKEVN